MGKYQLGTKENNALLKEMYEELLRFGREFPSEGGSSWYLDGEGHPMKERPRETWITCRMAHVYSIGAMLGYEGCAGLAAQALKGISGELRDTEHGGWYPGIAADGSYLPTKQCYAHAFVILAASSLKLAGIEGADKLLADALEVYDRYFWDEEQGLARDTWNTEFTECDPYRGVNANMHTVEAFLAVADACGRDEYRQRAGRIIDQILDFARSNKWRIPEHYTTDWQPDLECSKDRPDDPFKPYGATPGHGIEWARLVTQWARSTYGESEPAQTYIEAAEALYRRAIADAWGADGAPGIVYTTDWEGRPVVHDRMHWTLAEAINTSAVLYHVTGDEDYTRDYEQFMRYLDKTVRDHEHGSWYHQLDRHNELKETVWPGKSDLYHAFQSCLIPNLPVDVSIAAAVKRSAN